MHKILRTVIVGGVMLGFLSSGLSDFGAPIACAGTLKKHYKTYRAEQAPPVPYPLNDVRGNAALDGNNANSAYGDNSAGSNANGRTSGGAGGMN